MVWWSFDQQTNNCKWFTRNPIENILKWYNKSNVMMMSGYKRTWTPLFSGIKPPVFPYQTEKLSFWIDSVYCDWEWMRQLENDLFALSIFHACISDYIQKEEKVLT